MKAEILSLLRKTEGYISGQELCERFGVTRAAVWKVINGLKKEGYGIEAVTGRGYRLSSLPDVFSAEELESRMHTEWAGRNLVFMKAQAQQIYRQSFWRRRGRRQAPLWLRRNRRRGAAGGAGRGRLRRAEIFILPFC